ncbi:nuclease-related domain-containing protein [Herbaspirillum sp. GCM10030257]|uniref:nuclease-related domain-containing protein n=1 Tax=Herbaspirillum sp. GCM10030257 TaxID=3273393 RepID=UPI003616FC18
MSQQEHATEQRIEKGIGWLATIASFVINIALVYPMLAVGYPCKEPLIRAWQLDRKAEDYVHSADNIKLLKGLVLCMYAGALFCLFFVAPSKSVWFERYAWMLTSVFTAAGAAFVYNVIHWVGKLSEDPDVKRRAAGHAAEAHVKAVIDSLGLVYPGSRALHGTLLVFDSKSPGESHFSVELDHLFVTGHNCYLLETKYRNATVHAEATATEWKATGSDGKEGVMRNALLQAKNSARVLEKQLSLPYKLVPIVVIHGEHTQIVDGPANVVRSDRLPDLIAAFEQVEAANTLDPAALFARLRTYMATGEEAMQQHIERANLAKRRAEAKAIVNATSR